MSHPATSLPPGFRFHPTDEELILHYLRNRAAATPCPVSIIAEVDIYKFDPWDLPPKAMFGDREWYFFSPRDRKYPNGVRPNRAAASGYWKATGTDKPIHATSGNENIGVKKALVFYKGRPPKGLKTNWIMHEYRLAEAQPNTNTYRPMRLRDSSMRLDDWVLCRIYKKSNHVAGEVQATTEQEQDDSGSEDVACLPNSASMNTMQAKPLDLHKSSSLSEFLNLLFDNPAEILGPETGPAMAHAGSNQVMFNGGSSINNGNGYLYQKLTNGKTTTTTTTTTPVSVVDNTLKRHYTTGNIGDDAASFIPATKKLNNSCIAPSFTSQFNNPQYGVLNQALLNQQLLLNSHLGLQ